MNDDMVKDAQGRMVFRWARNIVVGTGTAEDKWWISSLDLDRYLDGTFDALREAFRHNYTGYGVIQGIADKGREGKEVVITPLDPRICNGAALDVSEWKSPNQLQIRYTPYVWGTKCVGAGLTPDEVLLHELVHAYQRLYGPWASSRTQVKGFDYDNTHEFAAILLTNIYASAKRRRALRKDHRDGTTLPAELHDDAKFFEQVPEHRDLVRELATNKYNYALCHGYVRHEAARFNPIRYFFDHRCDFPSPIPPPAPVPMVPDP